MWLNFKVRDTVVTVRAVDISAVVPDGIRREKGGALCQLHLVGGSVIDVAGSREEVMKAIEACGSRESRGLGLSL